MTRQAPQDSEGTLFLMVLTQISLGLSVMLHHHEWWPNAFLYWKLLTNLFPIAIDAHPWMYYPVISIAIQILARVIRNPHVKVDT